MAVQVICDVCQKPIEVEINYDTPYTVYPRRVRLVSEPILLTKTGIVVVDQSAHGLRFTPTVLNEFLAHADCWKAIHIHTR